jgi:hypothetical protein
MGLAYVSGDGGVTRFYTEFCWGNLFKSGYL